MSAKSKEALAIVQDPGDSRMVVQLTALELRSLVRDEVARAVRVITEHQPPSKSERWVDVATAAKHFKCTPRTIRNWIRNGAPARSFGPAAHPMIRIDLAEFEAWVDLGNNESKRAADGAGKATDDHA